MSDACEAIITIAAAVIIDSSGRTLLVRKRGTEAFMQPGGKYADGESSIDTLCREVKEELNCDTLGDIISLGQFRAPAANEKNTVVQADVFAVSLSGEVTPCAEIEEAIWVYPDEAQKLTLAPLTRQYILPWVRKRSCQHHVSN